MKYTDICNRPWMYFFVGAVILLILTQNFIMMRKAWKHAKEDLGIPGTEIKKGLIHGILVSIVPTIPVVIILLSLIPLLGTPLPWLRLSVIGSASFESNSANIGVSSVGETMTVGGYSILGWITACWFMSIAGSSSVIWSILAIRPIDKLFHIAEKINLKLILTLGTGCMVGIMAYCTYAYGLIAIDSYGIIFGISFLTGIILIVFSKKLKIKWLSEYTMPICMVLGMIAACILM